MNEIFLYMAGNFDFKKIAVTNHHFVEPLVLFCFGLRLTLHVGLILVEITRVRNSSIPTERCSVCHFASNLQILSSCKPIAMNDFLALHAW